MKQLLAQVGNSINYSESQMYLLRKQISDMETYIFGLLFIIVILFVALFLQWKMLRKQKVPGPSKSKQREPIPQKSNTPKQDIAAQDAKIEHSPKPSTVGVSPKQLPDPGLIFKFSLREESEQEKTIVIGQREGNIKTYSTEIVDDHLNIHIRILDQSKGQDIYNIPDRIQEEYQVFIRRTGKSLIYIPGEQNFREMSSRERIYIKAEPEATGDPTMAQIDPKQPLRFRIGDRLNQDGKFISGFFEFHFFTQDYEVKTKGGITKIEKNFFIRLYKIYPGYDTAAQTSEGLYPMIDPFTS